MRLVESPNIYKAFGLLISSEIHFPELIQSNRADVPADVEIRRCDQEDYWAELDEAPNKLLTNENQVMFCIPGDCRLSIKDGRMITFSAVQGADEDLIRLYILGTCMSVLLMQRGIFPLHGSAVVIQSKAYAIIGDSGAGKSTLASAMLSQGYKLLSDDLIAISLTGDNQTVMVDPAYPQQKLWQESLHRFGMTSSHYRSIFGRETKFSIPVPSNFYPDPLPLAGVFELVKAENNTACIRPIEKLDRLQTLFTHTFRQFLIPRLGLMDWHFHTSAMIANQIQMFQLSRPLSGYTIPQLVDLVLDSIQLNTYDGIISK